MSTRLSLRRVVLEIPALLVLIVLACAAPAPPTAVVPDLPALPTSVPSALGAVSVSIVDTVPAAPGTVNAGAFDALQRRIYIWSQLGRVQAWHTLEHERCHVEHFDSGIRAHHEVVERMCDAWANARLREMLSRRR